jgi:hypothetical protein
VISNIFVHWKTSVGGLLSVAGVVLAAVNTTSPNEKWILTATGLVSGLTGLLGKDTAAAGK